MHRTLKIRLAMALLLAATALVVASDVAGARTRPPPQKDGDVVREGHKPAAHPHAAQKKREQQDKQPRVEQQRPAPAPQGARQPRAAQHGRTRVDVQPEPQRHAAQPTSQPSGERERKQPVVVQPQPVQERQPVPSGQRLSEPRHKQLVADQQRRLTQYDARLAAQQRLAQQRTARLQQQNRMSQYRFQQEYLERLREQQARLRSARDYDYDGDPYFYTAPSYRYSRNGHYYETNQYGADLLRQAVNNGYEEGFRAGQADREDHWASAFRDSYAYQDANYGYGGFYVDQGTYNYYFREGFQRGYDDGYYTRSQYGNNTNGTFAVLGAVLSRILDLQSLR